MIAPEDYWSRVVAAFIEGRPAPSAPSADESELIHWGDRIHCLELLDAIPANGNGIGEDLMNASRQRRIQNLFNNRVFNNEMERVDTGAADCSLRYAWIKGGEFLRHGDYPKGTRRLSDLDLLIEKQDLPVWHEILRRNGYRTHRSPDWILDTGFDPTVSSTFYTKDTDRGKVLIDVHWHLVDYPARRACGRWNFDMEPIFRNIENHSLAPEHRILYLIDHAFSHEFRFWKFVVDLAYVLRRNSIDRNLLSRESKRTRYDGTFHLGIRFLQLMFEGNWPPVLTFFNELDRPLLSESGEKYVGQSFSGELAEGAYLQCCYRWLESLPERIAFVRKILFPSAAAVPRVGSNSSLLETCWLYVKRLRRVMTRVPGFLRS